MSTNNKLVSAKWQPCSQTKKKVTEVTAEFMEQNNGTKGFIPKMSNKMVYYYDEMFARIEQIWDNLLPCNLSLYWVGTNSRILWTQEIRMRQPQYYKYLDALFSSLHINVCYSQFWWKLNIGTTSLVYKWLKKKNMFERTSISLYWWCHTVDRYLIG